MDVESTNVDVSAAPPQAAPDAQTAQVDSGDKKHEPSQHELDAFKRRDAALEAKRALEARTQELEAAHAQLLNEKKELEFSAAKAAAENKEEFHALLDEMKARQEAETAALKQQALEREESIKSFRREQTMKEQLREAGFRDDYLPYIGMGSFDTALAIEAPDGGLDLSTCLPGWRDKMPEAFMTKAPEHVNVTNKAASLPMKNLEPAAWCAKYKEATGCSDEQAIDAWAAQVG